MDVVFVDVGGTLWPDIWPELAEDHRERVVRLRHRAPNFTESQAIDVVNALSGFDHPASPRQQTGRLVTDTLEHLDLEGAVPPGAVIDAMCLGAAGRVQPFPGAGDLLASLAARTRVIIASNVIWRGHDCLSRDFAQFGLAEHVDGYVTSLDVGWRKPHRHFFDAALAAGGAPAGQCGIVGNSESKDIEPGVALGMIAVRVAIEEARPSSSSAHYVCTALEQVTRGLLGNLEA